MSYHINSVIYLERLHTQPVWVFLIGIVSLWNFSIGMAGESGLENSLASPGLARTRNESRIRTRKNESDLSPSPKKVRVREKSESEMRTQKTSPTWVLTLTKDICMIPHWKALVLLMGVVQLKFVSHPLPRPLKLKHCFDCYDATNVPLGHSYAQ